MKTKLTKLIAILLSAMLLVGVFTGCSDVGTESAVTSDTDVVYGGDVDYDDDDEVIDTDEETIDTTSSEKSDGKTSSSKSGSSSKTSSGATVVGGQNASTPSTTYHADETAKKDFLETIPKSLSGKTVRVLIWWKAGVAETAKAKEFEEKTGIKIKFITSETNYTQKLSSMIAQGNPPDLACIGQENFPAIIMQDYFEPLSVGKLDLTDPIYDMDTMNQFKYQDTYYGAMIKSSTMITFNVLFYNADIFSRAGVKTPNQLWKENNWNWDTFVTTCKDIMAKSDVQAAVTGEYQGNIMVQTAGTDAVKIQNGKLINNTSDKKLLEAWQFLNDLRDKHKVMDTGMNSRGFYDGKAAMLMQGNFVMQKGDSLEKNMVYKWGYAPLPCPKGSDFTVSSSVKLWGFPKGTKNAEAASYWLRYWLDSTYDAEGSETWVSDDVADFNAWLWEQPKTFCNFQGVVNYGGNYNWGSMTAELAAAGSSNVKSVLDSWSKVIDANIAKMEKEFGK